MYQTKGLILRKYDAGEADRAYIIYTENFGKKQFLAKGALKIKSKMSSHLTEFAEIDLEFVKGKKKEQIVGAEIVNNFYGIKNDLRKIAIGNFIINAVDASVKWDYSDKNLYKLLKKSFEVIDCQNDVKKSYFSANIFIWKLLILLGYKPELAKCADCGASLGDNIYFNEFKADLVCCQCADGKSNFIKLKKSSINYLKGKQFSSITFDEIINIIRKFSRFHLEKELKSEVWLDKFF